MQPVISTMHIQKNQYTLTDIQVDLLLVWHMQIIKRIIVIYKQKVK